MKLTTFFGASSRKKFQGEGLPQAMAKATNR
jgi:hypothetical protein